MSERWKTAPGADLIIAVAATDQPRNQMLTRCRRGHEFTLDNTIVERTQRRCRTCRAANRKANRRGVPILLSQLCQYIEDDIANMPWREWIARERAKIGRAV